MRPDASPAEPSLDEAARWSRWLIERNRRAARTVLWLQFSLYPAFGLLDVLLAPRGALPSLLGVRAVVTVASAAMFPVIASALFDRWYRVFTPVFLVLGASGISYMTVHMGGLSSPYYAGLTLYVVAIGVTFVWEVPVIVATYAAVVGSFLIANLAAGTIGDVEVGISNLAFLCSTALVAGVGQTFQFRAQREQHVQRVDLERTSAHLERAHADLQQLDQFKSRFFANMTHELRTPLAMIVTPLELLMQGEMGAFTDAQRSSFQTMYRSALKLLKLINDLLDLSRLEESRLRLAVAEHDLGEHLSGLVEQTGVLAARKGVALRYSPGCPEVRIWCDLDRLERVFVNLLSNALKFTPPGGHVTVSLRDRGDTVEVEVADDGPGFPPEVAERLFERFYQVDMDGTRQHGGAGIGLALARELVLLHGGRIEAEGAPGRGASFRVALRKGRDHFRAEALVSPSAREGAGAGDEPLDWAVQLSASRDVRLLELEEAAERRIVERDADEGDRPYTALVVEDEPRIIRLVHMSLRREFKVLAAPDGLKGLELALRCRPSLVVTDLMMPGIDGLELVRRLREDERTRHVPIVMLTARGELEDRVKGLETGVSAYLTKPFSPKELVTCARSLVHAREETAELVLADRVESLETFSAGLAHELNNPLNYVKNALARVRVDAEKLLGAAAADGPGEPAARERGERLAARVRELLGIADAGLKRIAGTVELMSSYGRAGYRRELAPHDAWEAVRAVVAVVLPATGRPVEVAVELEGEATVACVPEELHQVVSNLVQNAIEAVPDGGHVWVRGTVEGEALVLRVKDDGPGIAPEVQARLFTPFFTTKGPGRGTGLGLTITRRVVQRLRGSVAVASTPGHGAEFTVRLPLLRPQAPVRGAG